MENRQTSGLQNKIKKKVEEIQNVTAIELKRKEMKQK